jgi:DNA modification methylase
LKNKGNITFKLGDARNLISEIGDSTVSTIYFDPPFNTGRDFKYSSLTTGNFGFSDKFESDDEYMSLIEPILEQGKRVLKADGSLFFHISAEEMMIPHVLCNKYFEKVQPIFWKRSRSKNNVKKKLGALVDVIFWCSDSKSPKFNLVYQPLDSYYAENSYKNKDPRGNYALGHIVYSKTQATSNPERNFTYNHSDGRSWTPQYGWRVSYDELLRLMDQDRIHFPKKRGNLYRKIYAHESKGKPCTNLWDDIHSIAMGVDGTRKYPTQKPAKLLSRIIEMSSNPGDLILDPMAGSGTTAFAASNLGRNSIVFDSSLDAQRIFERNLKNHCKESE